MSRDAVPGRLRAGPFTTATGLSEIGRARLAGSGFRRLTRGVYQEAGAPRGYAEKIRAMRLVLPPDAVLVGLAAAWAHGVHLARSTDPVEVMTTPGRVRPRAGLLLRSGRIEQADVVDTAFGPATTPLRTAFDLARSARLPHADVTLRRLNSHDGRLPPQPPSPYAMLQAPDPEVVARRLATSVARTDAVLRAADLDASELVALIDANTGAREVRSARVVAALADVRAESPPESVLRVRIVLAGLPRPEPQLKIFSASGILVARTDLGWPGLLLAGEYNGAHHYESRQAKKDNHRTVKAAGASWLVVPFDSRQLADVPTLIRDLHAIMVDRVPRD